MTPDTDQFKTSALKSGASADPKPEAKKRLTQYGPNELVDKKTNLLLEFLSYFWGPIPWMIEIAVILSDRR
jgi:H+-transporting ATPase